MGNIETAMQLIYGLGTALETKKGPSPEQVAEAKSLVDEFGGWKGLSVLLEADEAISPLGRAMPYNLDAILALLNDSQKKGERQE